MRTPVPQEDTPPSPAAVDAAARCVRMIEYARNGNRVAFSGYVLKDKSGQPIDVEPIHKRMLNFVDECWRDQRAAGILAPWRHGKTTLLIEGIALHEIGLDRNVRIKMVSGDDVEAMKRTSAVRRFISSQEYRDVFPNVRPARDSEWTKHTIYVERDALGRDPTLSAAGVMTSEAGGGYDILMFDDVVTWKNSIATPASRQMVYESLSNVWLQRVDTDVRYVLVGTRWHADDAYGALLRVGLPWRWLIVRVNATFDGFVVEEREGAVRAT